MRLIGPRILLLGEASEEFSVMAHNYSDVRELRRTRGSEFALCTFEARDVSHCVAVEFSARSGS